MRSTPGTFRSVLTKETLKIIEESRWARVDGKTGRYLELKREAARALRRDKEAQLPGVCEVVLSLNLLR